MTRFLALPCLLATLAPTPAHGSDRGAAGGATASLASAPGEPGAAPPRSSRRLRSVSDRPLGLLELGAGLLALPDAAVCVERLQEGCETGDASPVLEAWQVFRLVPRFALGAGLTLGLTTTADAPRTDPPGVHRDHERRYLTLEAVGRWYFLDGDALDAWAGLTSGLVVVSDSFTPSQPQSQVLIGPRANTLRTEGLALGLAVGLAWQVSGPWFFGGVVRSGSWFLPSSPATNALGDEASLTGRVNVLTAGVSLAYALVL